ncbi:PEP-CTERM sorting domain-containing protein [Aeoliella sp.]|uniref:PEP-CTERM sorting domain-containing protein n=1 Tax=Aeoliella sp. TaxID=2795800 RepID=UPI003CCBC626
MKILPLAAISLLLAAPTTWAATATLVDDFRRVSYGQVGRAIVNNVVTVDFRDQGQDEASDPSDTLQEIRVIQVRGSNPPGLYSGHTEAIHTSTYLTPGGATPAFGNAIEGFTVDDFNLFTRVSVTDPFLSSTTSTIGQVSVTLETNEPLRWSWTADVALQEQGVLQPTYLFSIYDNSDTLFSDFRQQAFDTTIQQGGVLPAGEWTVEVFVNGSVSLPVGSGSMENPPMGEGRVLIDNGRFTLSAVPEPTSVVLFVLGGGALLVGARVRGSMHCNQA